MHEQFILMMGGEGRSSSRRAERCDEQGVSIDTICTHNFSCLHQQRLSVAPLGPPCSSSRLSSPPAPSWPPWLGQPATPPPAAARSVGNQISSHAQESLVSYALLAIAREPFELCSHFKSPSPVSRRELSIDLRWRASRPKPEFPAPEIETERRCAQGERGVKTTL